MEHLQHIMIMGVDATYVEMQIIITPECIERCS